MLKLLIPAMALLGLAACDGGSGDSGTTAGDTIDSCNWVDVGLCYEYTNYAGTEDWCSQMQDDYGFTTVYDTTGCPGGAEASCDLPAGGDLEVPGVAYYYADFENDPATECADAGGTLL
jgi:hypothetical protein